MRPGLVNATLKPKSERQVSRQAGSFEMQDAFQVSQSQSETAAADSTTNTLWGDVAFNNRDFTQTNEVHFSQGGLKLISGKLTDSDQSTSDSFGLLIKTKEQDYKVKQAKAMIMQVFSRSNKQDFTSSSGDQDVYTIPVSYLSQNTIASLTHGELVHIDRMVRKQEEIVNLVREHFHPIKQDHGEVNFAKLKEAILIVVRQRKGSSASLNSRCFVWAIVTSAVLVFTRKATNQNSSSIGMLAHSLEPDWRTMHEVGQLINQDKRLEAIYSSAILKGFEELTPVDTIDNYDADVHDDDLTCEQTLNLLYRYLKLTQGLEGADFVFVRLRELVRQMYGDQRRIFE